MLTFFFGLFETSLEDPFNYNSIVYIREQLLELGALDSPLTNKPERPAELQRRRRGCQAGAESQYTPCFQIHCQGKCPGGLWNQQVVQLRPHQRQRTTVCSGDIEPLAVVVRPYYLLGTSLPLPCSRASTVYQFLETMHRSQPLSPTSHSTLTVTQRRVKLWTCCMGQSRLHLLRSPRSFGGSRALLTSIYNTMVAWAVFLIVAFTMY